MAFTTKPFRSEKEFIAAVDAYIDKHYHQGTLATAQGFCNQYHFRYELYEGDLKKKFPNAYAYARESFYAAAVNAPRAVNPTTVKSIIDWYLKTYTSIVETNADENNITVEMDEETKKDAV